MHGAVTFGLDYTVRPGQEEAFIRMFAAVVERLAGIAGHKQTRLFRQVDDPSRFLVYSEWSSKPEFEAFLRSEAFRAVKDWGRSDVLVGPPNHSIFTR